MTIQMKQYQGGSSIFLFFFGILICLEARKLGLGRFTRPGPGYFPFWLGLGLAMVSLVMAIRLWRRKTGPMSPSKSLWKELHWEKTLFSFLGLMAYAFLLGSLGYCFATFALMFFLFWAIGNQRWFVAIFGSALTSLLTYILFRMWLQVQLPVGLWGI
jgi:hypothetical protein